MRTIALFLFIFSLILTGCGGSSVITTEDGRELNGQQQREELERITSMIENGNFTFTVQSVNPQGSSPIYPSTEYTLSAEDGTYRAYLPYFGRSYRAEYGGNGGIDFEGKPEELEIETNRRRNKVTVSFTIDQPDEQYDVTLEIGAGSYGTMTIISPYRRAISYYGNISG